MYLLPAVASGAPLLDVIHHCDALALLRALPDGCIDSGGPRSWTPLSRL